MFRPSSPPTPDRRLIATAMAAGAVASFLPDVRFMTAVASPIAPSHDLGSAAGLRAATTAFLARLSEAEMARANFPFGGQTWRKWNFFGTTGFTKPGLRLDEMDEDQKAAAWDLAGAILSPAGLAKARRVMALQDVLREQGDRFNQRSSERFSFAIFGAPGPRGLWGVRIEGHHLSLTYTIENDRLVGVTPSCFSALPNQVESGRYAGLVALREENALARSLGGDMDGAAKRRAVLRGDAIRNVLSVAGMEDRFEARAGVPLADLTVSQRDRLTAVIEAFCLEHLAVPHAEAVRHRVLGQDPGGIHFAFAGSPAIGEPFYYRIHGAHFVSEFATVDRTGQHLHLVTHLL
jgi:hypothetical protein